MIFQKFNKYINSYYSELVNFFLLKCHEIYLFKIIKSIFKINCDIYIYILYYYLTEFNLQVGWKYK